MNCLKCNGKYLLIKQKLEISDKYVGKISIDNVTYYQCGKCDEKLLPVEAARQVDKRRHEILHEYLLSQPISAFFSASETSSFLGISRQALHKHKRIRKGFIYNTLFDNRLVYLRKSVELYKKKGDGRFDISCPRVALNLKLSEWSTELFKAPETIFATSAKGTNVYPLGTNAYLKTSPLNKVGPAWYEWYASPKIGDNATIAADNYGQADNIYYQDIISIGINSHVKATQRNSISAVKK